MGMSTPCKPLKPSRERLDKLFSNLDLSGTEEWDEYDQQRVGELIEKYHHVFALEDTELGCTDIAEHEIILSDPKPFKDWYHRIPPHQHEEIQVHLQEMPKIGATRKFISPWASPVILVGQKDGSLQFCIDLHTLNSRMLIACLE